MMVRVQDNILINIVASPVIDHRPEGTGFNFRKDGNLLPISADSLHMPYIYLHNCKQKNRF